MSSNVLSSRDVNTSHPHSPTKTTDDSKTKSVEYDQQMLQSRMNEDDSKQVYISPSDNILSPCSAKLSAMKNKHFSKAKPQSLFAKTSTRNATRSGLGVDVPVKEGGDKDEAGNA